MQMRLSTQLAIAMVFLVVATAGAVGIFTYRAVESTILPTIFERIGQHTRERANDLQSYVRSARLDALSFRDTFLVRGILNSTAKEPLQQAWRSIFAMRLVNELKNKPEYYRFRLVGAADGGREIVRVDRSGPSGAIRIVPAELLQREGDRRYFQASIRLPVGQVRVSPIELGRDANGIENPHVPILQAATPVYAPNGGAILVVTVDMRAAFERVRATKRDGGQIYLVNADGDYLVHPDRSREFAFESGPPVRAQNDFPNLTARIGSDDTVTQVTHRAVGDRIGAVMTSFRLPDGPRLALIETVPHALLAAPAFALGKSSLLVAAAAILVAAAFAVAFARSLAKPLAQMTAAVERFTIGRPFAVPTSASGEIGTLARAFERMAVEVRDKTAEIEQFTERDRLYIAVVESSEDSVHVRSKDGAISAWNPASERIFGYTAAEAIGQPIGIIVPPERRTEPLAVLERFAKGERLATFETVRMRKNGDRFEALVTVSPLHAGSSEAIGTATITRDISVRKQIEERYRVELRDAQAELARVVRLTTVGEMAATIAHEINQPLAAVVTNGAAALRWLENRPPEIREAREAIRRGVNEANRASEIINRIRALLKREKMEYGALDLNAALIEVVGFTLGERRAHRVVVETELDAGLPPVRGNRVQLQQVALNLMLNAIDATSAVSGRQRVLSVRTSANGGDSAVVVVEDSGVGLDPETAEHLFEPFFTTKPEGMGMGLAIARSIVEAHGGRLWAAPGSAGGAAFCFTVPYAAGDVP